MGKECNFSAIRALAVDLDGTALLPDNRLGERTRQCLKRLIKNGMQVIICTGRAIESSYRYYSALEAEGPIVFFNGAEIASVPEVEIIESRLLDIEVVKYGIELAQEMDAHFQMFLPPKEKSWETLLIGKMRPEAEMYRKHTGVNPVVADLSAAIAAPEVKGCVKAAFITDPGLHEEIRKKMTGRFGSRIYIARTYPTFLEIMAAGVSKGEGLKTVMNCRGLRPEEVMAFGDEENDLPMFNAAGFSAAPLNAKEKVRDSADYVFGSNAEEGLADFLNKFY